MDKNPQSHVVPPLDPPATAAAPAQAPRADERAARTMTGPPQRAGRLGIGLLLLACFIVAAPMLLIDLHRSDAVDPAEINTLATSVHTYRQTTLLPPDVGSIAERYTPSVNQTPQLQTPPGITWLHLIAFKTARVWSSDPTERKWRVGQLILLGRLTSFAFALLMLGAVYWAGMSIGRLSTAAFATLICAANMVFVYHGRLGSEVMPGVALMTISIAAALWAVRPLRPAACVFRQALGWLISGLTLGAAILTVGPFALIAVVLPVAAIILFGPQRLNRLLGLVAAIAIGILLIVPWIAHVHENSPEVYRLWLTQMLPADRTLSDLATTASHRALGILIVVLPWTFWLIGAIAQPFSASSKGVRGRLFLGWTWFVSMAVLVMFCPPSQTHSWLGDPLLLVILPAAAVLMGQVFAQYALLAGEGRFPRLWRMLRWPHILMLLLGSLAVPMLLNTQSVLIDWHVIAGPIASQPGPWFWTGMAAVLLAVAVLGLRWTFKDHPGRAVTCWAAWMIALATMLVIPLSRGADKQNPMRQIADRFERIPGEKRVFVLHDANVDEPVDGALLLYAARALPPITLEQLMTAGRSNQPLYVIGSPRAIPQDVALEPTPPLENLDLQIWYLPADASADTPPP